MGAFVIIRATNERGMLVVDWKKIRAEYLAGGTSYRILSTKYGVPRTTLERKAKLERWNERRGQIDGKVEAETIDAITQNEVNKAVSILGTADIILDKTTNLINSLDTVDVDTLKTAAYILKLLKDVKDVKSDADMREQEARIAKLRKEAEDDTPEDREVNVNFIGDIEQYSK